jgi:OmpA-OmpF porin, OOP family
MIDCRRVRNAAFASRACYLPSVVCLLVSAVSWADPPEVVDSQSIVRSLAPAPAVATRALSVEPRSGTAGSGGAASASDGRTINLDIRFGNDSDRLSSAAHGQLDQLGAALKSPELAQLRFRIAGHTSAAGSPQHNRQLSDSRARAVRSYLIERQGIAADRLEAVGFGADKPLPQYPPNALQQRRVEISTLPPAS